ncbi:protein ENHANCED DISEASE RESISTANCE 2-like [Ipomoea triloba]|uniref:protein ENHANCED DISEASE RESISTANCE 2-like n=1 Tax=Ipomoea triloba TaxID=35885 RepID=UPI00125D751F|nr:protein ENHANCED DISEASE RESISTANCE 2-like [Ipomoea triloba]
MCPTKQKENQKLAGNRSAAAAAVCRDWKEEAISGGSLKRVDLNNGSNGWASPPGDLFHLRAPNYFAKKTKVPSGEWLLEPAGVDWLRSSSKLDHVLARPDNRVMHALRRAQSQGKSRKTFVLAVNLQVPGREHHSAVFYFATRDDAPLEPGSLLYRFVNGDDAYRNSRFKIVNRIVKGPWIVKAAVGNYSACILGRALNCYYHRGPNYLEIDVDNSSSAIASAILHLALGYVRSVTIDMGFLVESQSEEELPEKLFGAVRICQMEMSSAAYVDSTSPAKVSPAGHFQSSSRVQAEDDGDSEAE